MVLKASVLSGLRGLRSDKISKVQRMNRACERLALYSRTNSKHSARQMYPSELHWTTGALLLLQPKVILSSGLADAVESRCTDERNGRNAKTAAPAIENENDQADDKSHNDQDISHKPKGRGRGNRGKREDAPSVPGYKYEGYCNFNKVLCGNWGHHAKDCFYNPQSDKYKGDEFVKQHAAKKQEALQKITGAAATAVDHAEAAQVEEATMNLDSMYRTWLQAKNES